MAFITAAGLPLLNLLGKLIHVRLDFHACYWFWNHSLHLCSWCPFFQYVSHELLTRLPLTC